MLPKVNLYTLINIVLLPQLSYLQKIAPLFFYRIIVGVCGDFDIQTDARYIVQVLTILKYHSVFLFKTLIDLVVYDVPGRARRFVVIYLLLSFRFNARLAVRTQVNEILPLISVVQLFQNANWLEREVWDMFGIFFFQHPDLRRLLTDYGFRGYPLRKDFPLTGYTEIWYSAFAARILYLPVSLVQEYREYTYDLFRGRVFLKKSKYIVKNFKPLPELWFLFAKKNEEPIINV